MTSVHAVQLPPADRSWRTVLRRRPFHHHNRLVAAVVLANLCFVGSFDADRLTALVVANLTLAALIRQQLVINLLFRLATSVPTHWPLKVRWTLGKVYHFGGLHVGAAICATAWFLVLATTTTGPPLVLALTWTIMALLGALIVLALPRLRAKHHDLFERTHRFGGWSVLVLFGVLSAVQNPVFLWPLALVVASVALPWLRLRRVPVHIVSPSPHVALVSFDHGVTPFAGSSTTVSRNPLLEWHSFANVPAPGRSGFRLTISRAGDWTAKFIADQPSHVWVKGIPTAGVGNIDKLFTRVVWVATGSGIGPCLPHLLAGDTPSVLVWSTRNPRRTYGDALVDEILGVQPDAVVWDTESRGKPDLVALAYDAWKRFDAEAVICISNKPTTWQVVEEMESRGIPAYGAIWDS
ncbi:membrane protein [Lentzea aerocolonigenes]|uniref:Membrane protein n=1 Tax=Lentzea aerocolonigenes TaxID=68170 RepID=A0A0F0GYA6_LENAE|nr:membrane protein [Lentzea aerocolonigenes]KJK48290.1 membrane protein [Lentzea aerocolonigenes]